MEEEVIQDLIGVVGKKAIRGFSAQGFDRCDVDDKNLWHFDWCVCVGDLI